MTGLHDILIARPLGETLLHALLFVSFALHLVFVLLTVGTALLAGGRALVRRLRAGGATEGGPPVPALDLLKPFFVYKSVAIVLGVGPLVLLAVGHPIAFGTAASLIAPAWLLLVGFLVAALVAIELAARRTGPPRRRDVLLVFLGAGLLLAVATTFAAFVTIVENPGAWADIYGRGGLPVGLAGHWALRVVHVAGAAIVVAAAAQAIRAPDVAARRVLLAWVGGGLLFQVVAGVALYASLPRPPGAVVDGVVLVAVLVAALLLWAVARWRRRDRFGPRPNRLLAGVLALVVTMLVARQLLQERVIRPFAAATAAAAAPARAARAPYRPLALATYGRTLAASYDAPFVLYEESCAPCHGVVANGAGESADELAVAPEDLAAIRAPRSVVMAVLKEGRPGTGMPRFGFYLAHEREELLDVLEDAGMGARPAPIERTWSAADEAHAERAWEDTCAVCHGRDGRPTPLARRFAPPPPDLTRYTFAADRVLDVITWGYPGTRMTSYRALPRETRRALVARVHGLYDP